MATPLSALHGSVRVVVDAARELCDVLPGVVAVGLVGSWARCAGRPGSDVDLVVLTTSPAAMLESNEWFALFDRRAELVRSSDFGAIAERRLRLPDGLVVEVGVGDPSWAAVDPIDEGTRRVAGDGIVALCDPVGLLAALIRAVSGPSELPAAGSPTGC